MATTPEEIVQFWFGETLVSSQEVDARVEVWFGKNDEFAREIQRRFGSLLE